MEQIYICQPLSSVGNFIEELWKRDFRDECYLPFEGAGAVCSREISKPKVSNRFDLASVTDVIINLRYTALDDGAMLRQQAIRKLKEHLEE